MSSLHYRCRACGGMTSAGEGRRQAMKLCVVCYDCKGLANAELARMLAEKVDHEMMEIYAGEK